MSAARYDTVIGLEIHVQLATHTKMFCGDVAEFGAESNTHVCPVCLGLPGALPAINGAAVELAVAAALALDCAIHATSVFARKNYFYPDLPKGYQITQYDRPLASGGWLDVPGELPDGGSVRIRRVHMEEDAGKSLHDRLPERSAIDLNRAGVPLIEIVTEPDIRSPTHARAFLVRLKQILEYLAVGDCDMEKGSLRVDANLSLRLDGATELGTKTEVKNLNSFANVERALRFEAQRQALLLGRGEPVIQETLLWDENAGEARSMRGKEESHDYRYFPEPDLPPLVLDDDVVDRIRGGLPELPDARARRFQEQLGIPEYDALVLTASRPLADYYDALADVAADAKAASNWVMTDVLAWLNERHLTADAFPIPPSGLAELIGLVENDTISTTLARTVFARMTETGRSAAEIVEAEGLAQVRDESRLEAWVDAVVEEHPDEARRLAAGETRLMGFFMGQIMRRSGGKADPRRTTELLRRRLEG